jgi:putative phosphoesterase
MRIGLLADAHGNAAALRTAISLLERRADRLLFLGDAVDEYGSSSEAVELIRERDIAYILGNHERILLSPAGEQFRARSGLKADIVHFLESLPSQMTLEVDGKRLLMIHGSPWPPFDEYILPQHPLLSRFDQLGVDYVATGHTHVSMAKWIGTTLVINPGSVGVPINTRDRRLSFALLDTSTDEVEFELFESASATNGG